MKARSMLAFNSVTTLYLRLLDALQQSAIATTIDGVVVDWNRSAERMYGWRREDAVGRNIIDITPSLMSRAEAGEIMESLGHGRIWSGEFPVRTRGGDSFVASVTDVPVVDDAEQIVGVVGVSAPSRGPASLASVLIRFGAACDSLWPGQMEVALRKLGATIPASEPHVLQLLSLIIMRYAGALADGSHVELSVAAAADSVFTDFGIHTRRPSVYIRFRTRSAEASYSVLRDEISAARPTNYAAALVRLLGGWLFLESGGNGTQITHLLLPVGQ